MRRFLTTPAAQQQPQHEQRQQQEQPQPVTGAANPPQPMAPHHTRASASHLKMMTGQLELTQMPRGSGRRWRTALLASRAQAGSMTSWWAPGHKPMKLR